MLNPYKWIGLLVLVAALLATGFGINHRMNSLKERAVTAEQMAATIAIERDNAWESVRIVTKYVDRVSVVREKAATIIKEVPVYVTEKADADCALTTGFRWLHDDAAQGSATDRTGNPDERATGLELSTVANTLTGNYFIYHETVEQVHGLQEFIRSIPNVTVSPKEGDTH